MPELRKDPILGRWIIISAERAARPTDFMIPERKAKKGACPFCPGNEDMTPPEIYSVRNGDGRDQWQVRVVPNKYPALRIEGDLNKRGDGIYDQMNGIGAHEVIIETPRHVASFGELTFNEASDVLATYRHRTLDLKKDRRLIYVMLFKNVGQSAGASLEHTHSQLIALPSVPKIANEEMNGSKVFYDYRGRCLFCDMIRQELQNETRVISYNNRFILFTPFASRFPFEMWILPREHHSHFENTPQEYLPDLAAILVECIQKLEKVFKNPSYNFMIHTTPFTIAISEYYHWHIEVIPRLTRVAGFEWGTDFYINPMPPEDAARYLRQKNNG